MNPIAAANAISGERASATVSFPLTGDPELDAVSGILWVLNETKLGGAAKVRVLQYLAGRFAVQAEKEIREAKRWETMNAYLQPQSQRPSINSPWYTASDSAGLMNHPLTSLCVDQPPQTYPPTSVP